MSRRTRHWQKILRQTGSPEKALATLPSATVKGKGTWSGGSKYAVNTGNICTRVAREDTREFVRGLLGA